MTMPGVIVTCQRQDQYLTIDAKFQTCHDQASIVSFHVKKGSHNDHNNDTYFK